jgi:hemolysin activation/secretion protein
MNVAPPRPRRLPSPWPILATLFVAWPAVAQQQTRLPTQVERPATPPAAAEPLTVIDLSVVLQPGLRAPADIADEPVDIVRIELMGDLPADRTALDALVAPLAGKSLPVARIYEVATAITRELRNQGLPLATAFVPEQSVAEGVYRIDVLLGWIARVDVVGIEGPLADKLKAIARPALERPTRRDRLERALVLLRDVPGVTVEATLQPRDAEGEATVLVLNARHTPLTGGANFDSRGSKYAGPGRGSVEVTAQSVAGLGELVRLRSFGAYPLRELAYGALDLSVPIGDAGLKLDGSVSTSRSRSGFDLDEFNVKGRSLQLELTASYPVFVSARDTVRVFGGLQSLDSYVDAVGARFYADRTRALALGVQWDMVGPFDGGTRLRTRTLIGIDGLGSSGRSNASRRDITPTAVRMQFDLAHLQRLTDRLEVTFQAEAQVAGSGLHAADEFAYGGGRFGRGFDPAEITGDHGAAASLELAWRLPLPLPGWLEAIGYGFGDVGAVRDRDPIAARFTRASTGIGLRVEVDRRANAFIEYAWPIGPGPSTDSPSRSGRMLFGAALQF